MEQCQVIGGEEREKITHCDPMVFAISELRERFGITESKLIALALRVSEKRVQEIIRQSVL